MKIKKIIILNILIILELLISSFGVIIIHVSAQNMIEVFQDIIGIYLTFIVVLLDGVSLNFLLLVEYYF